MEDTNKIQKQTKGRTTSRKQSQKNRNSRKKQTKKKTNKNRKLLKNNKTKKEIIEHRKKDIWERKKETKKRTKLKRKKERKNERNKEETKMESKNREAHKRWCKNPTQQQDKETKTNLTQNNKHIQRNKVGEKVTENKSKKPTFKQR